MGKRVDTIFICDWCEVEASGEDPRRMLADLPESWREFVEGCETLLLCEACQNTRSISLDAARNSRREERHHTAGRVVVADMSKDLDPIQTALGETQFAKSIQIVPAPGDICSGSRIAPGGRLCPGCRACK